MAYAKINSVTDANMAKIFNVAKAGFGKIAGADAPDSDTSFTFTMNTENAGSASDTFVLPLVDDGTINIDVDWGDSSTDNITAYDQAEITHVYSSAGTYTVQMSGTIRGFTFNNSGDKLKILNISQWGDFNVTRASAFMGCNNLDCSATDAPTVSTDPTAMFYWANNLTNIGGDWDMSGVTSLYLCFYQAAAFNGASLDSWDTSSVTNMNGVFRRAPAFNADISAWDTSSVTNMSNMFDGWGPVGSFNQDLSSWDISGVTTFGTNFMRVQTLSTAIYDEILLAWADQDVQSDLSVNFGNSTYTAGAAEAARTSLIDNDSWTITDGGAAG